jgi:SM-20-related protein
MFENIIDKISTEGWSLTLDFLSPSLLSDLQEDLRAKQSDGLFRQAGIGQSEAQLRTDIRNDQIMWWKIEDLCPAQEEYLRLIALLQEAVRDNFHLNLPDFECHYAIYEAGGFYHKHLDSFKNSSARQISCILYLNDAWQPEDGGALRIYESGQDDSASQSISPTGASLVCLQSTKIWHEVSPSFRTRKSVTGWLRREE